MMDHIKWYKELYGINVGSGTRVAFFDGAEGLMHVGIITELHKTDYGWECTIKQADGRERVRSFDHDIDHKILFLLHPGDARAVTSSEWSE